MIGASGTHVVAAGETLLDIARRHGLGYVELAAANPGVDPWLPPPGLRLRVPGAHLLPPGPRNGIVVNLGDQRLYHFAVARTATYPIGIADDAVAIRTGITSIARKRVRPVWYPPPSVRAENPELPERVPPGPDNPLGAYALDLGWPAIAIHGTNQPDAVGRRVSHGCFRLYPEDIERLFVAVTVGTSVRVIDEPVKLGWHQGGLMLEVHPPLASASAVERGEALAVIEAPLVAAAILAFAPDRRDRVDWE
ncbi:MAG: L,D-transpeptidase family protein, partial [Azospirillum sp.]|nr:L,D-transpeptidase family protein [Azospirillum sp.]